MYNDSLSSTYVSSSSGKLLIVVLRMSRRLRNRYVIPVTTHIIRVELNEK